MPPAQRLGLGILPGTNVGRNSDGQALSPGRLVRPQRADEGAQASKGSPEDEPGRQQEGQGEQDEEEGGHVVVQGADVLQAWAVEPIGRQRNERGCPLAACVYLPLGALIFGSLLRWQLVALGLGLALTLHRGDLVLKRALRLGCRTGGVLPILDAGRVFFARVWCRIDCVVRHAPNAARAVPD